MKQQNNNVKKEVQTSLINESLIKDVLKYKPIKYIAIGGCIVLSIFIVGKTLGVLANSVRGFNSLKSAINGN